MKYFLNTQAHAVCWIAKRCRPELWKP